MAEGVEGFAGVRPSIGFQDQGKENGGIATCSVRQPHRNDASHRPSERSVMPRSKQADEAGHCYHAINRGNARRKIFHKDADYEAFERTIDEGLGRYPVQLLSFCLMPNHWHLALRPTKDGAMGRFVGWLTATQTARYHAHNHTAGTGHLYQGPFKSFPVQDDSHLLTLCRYVERNALSAKLCARAEDWRFGSLYRRHHRCDRDPRLLSSWPVRRPPGWVEQVDTPLTERELEAIRTSVRRGRPYGEKSWTEATCERAGLWSTVRPIGRPPKRKKQRVQPDPA